MEVLDEELDDDDAELEDFEEEIIVEVDDELKEETECMLEVEDEDEEEKL